MIPIAQPYFDEEEIRTLKECLDSKWVTQGPFTDRFEHKFQEFHPSKYAYAVSSCTAALHIAMLALGLKEGDEVIVPAYTWITSASCAEYVGANVRFVDVNRKTFNIDVTSIERAITKKTKAIVAVHLFGYAAEMDTIMAIAKAYNLFVVEDCACAIGTKYKGKPVGTIGDIGCFSFHPRKVITTGEGGICCTDDDILAAKIQQYRNHGASVVRRTEEYGQFYDMGIYDDIGYNLRISDLQAAVGVAQFNKLENLLEDRRHSALYYYERLKGIDELTMPEIEKEYGPTFQSFVVSLKDQDRTHRNRVMNYLKGKEIQTRPGTIAIHRTEYNSRKYGIRAEDFPNSCLCEDTSITLPIYPFMSNDIKDKVVECLIEAL